MLLKQILINFVFLKNVMKKVTILLLFVASILIMVQCSVGAKYNDNNKQAKSRKNRKTEKTEYRIIDTVEVTAKATVHGPAIVFTDTVRDLKVVKGDVVPIVFSFRNTGDSVLTISEVIPSCDCLTPTASKTSIAPGEKAEIDVIFDSKDESGSILRQVYVTTNVRRAQFILAMNIDVQPAGNKK